MARNQARIENTANALATALKSIQDRLERPPSPKHYTHVKPQDIRFMPQLFQPREFSFGAYEFDREHVKNLAHRINSKGELDPVLILRVGRVWVCVDGHHRLAAYKKEKWRQPIKCEWFDGDAREAANESLRRNEVAKLEITQGDRFEAAWKHTVLGWGSKAEVIKITGASDGTVALMRRVKTMHERDDGIGRNLRKKIGQADLTKVRWRTARAAFLNLDMTEEKSLDERAGILARNIANRLSNKLSKDPAVTARALSIYDPTLPEALMREFRILDEVDLEAAAQATASDQT